MKSGGINNGKAPSHRTHESARLRESLINWEKASELETVSYEPAFESVELELTKKSNGEPARCGRGTDSGRGDDSLNVDKTKMLRSCFRALIVFTTVMWGAILVLYAYSSGEYKAEAKFHILCSNAKDQATRSDAAAWKSSRTDGFVKPCFVGREGKGYRNIGSHMTQASFDVPDFPTGRGAQYKFRVERPGRDIECKVERGPHSEHVTITMTGRDSQKLVSALDHYARGAFRELMSPVKLAVSDRGPKRSNLAYTSRSKYINGIETEMRRIELMQRHCELAIKLLDNKRRSLSMFLPNGIANELSSLNHINKELVKLSIERERLATRFQPTSPEIQRLDREIHGLQALMRRHLVDQVAFLRANKKQLAVYKKKILGGAKNAVVDTESVPKAEWAGQFVSMRSSGENPVGTTVLYEKPVIVHTPFIAAFLGKVERSLASLLGNRYHKRRFRPRPVDLNSPKNESGTQANGACEGSRLSLGRSSAGQRVSYLIK